MMTLVIKIGYKGYLTCPQTSVRVLIKAARHQVRSRLQFAFDIEALELEAVQNHIRDVALLTATDVDDWNYRFIEDRRNPYGDNLISFTHPTAKAQAMPISKFMRMPEELA